MSILRRPPDIWPRVGMAVTASPHTGRLGASGTRFMLRQVPRLDVRVLPSPCCPKDRPVPRPPQRRYGLVEASPVPLLPGRYLAAETRKSPWISSSSWRRHPPASPRVHLRHGRHGSPGTRSPLKIDSMHWQQGASGSPAGRDGRRHRRACQKRPKLATVKSHRSRTLMAIYR
jgi:hypothetical protein